MEKKSKSHPILLQERPWANNENKVWLASSINLYRNFEKFKFPIKLDSDRKHQMISLASNHLLKTKLLSHPELIPVEEMSPTEKEFLVEHFLSPQSFHQAHSGEGFILDDTGEFLASLNIQNHIHFELIDTRGDLESSWNRIVTIETELGKTIPYTFSPKFGFMTSNPRQCGTGFLLTVFLQPSALIHTGKIDEVIERLTTNDIALTGLQGDPNKIIGDIFAVHNRRMLGVTEENIISIIRIFTTKLLVEENGARSALRKEENPEVMDKVSRAYAVLMHSYQMETIEALDAISLLKLGVDLGWIEGITIAELNHLFFNCRRGHLLSRYENELVSEEIPHKRSEFIHDSLKKLKLKI